jgi:hypothetical protein
MTYLNEQKVIGFAQHIIGGSLTGEDQPMVESLCAVTAPDSSHKQIWAIIKRTINGGTKRYVEFMEELYEPTDEDDKDNYFFVDSGLTYSGVATNVITGLDHLEGQEVAIWADGGPRPNQVVVGGSITLGTTEATKASVAQIGLPTEFKIETLDPEGGGDEGTSLGKTKRVSKVKLKFINTLGCQVGPDEDNMEELVFRESDDPMDSSPPLFTGWFDEIDFEGDYTDDPKIIITSTQPSPITIAAIVQELAVNG